MNVKKIVTIKLIVILIISDIFLVFGQDLVGEYIYIFAMMAILSGCSLIIMLIVNRKNNSITTEKVDVDYLIELEDLKEMKICNICNTPNNIKASYCKKCNNDLKDIVCPICKTVNLFDQKYCSNCDTILQNEKRHL